MNGNATRRFTHHSEGLDFPLAMREGSTTSLFHLDAQGNVYLLTDTSGTRRSEYRYRAWGDRYVTPTGEAAQSPFGYKGREEDRETGLVYMRNRYYSPRLERFVNQDPIGIAGGLNLYGFAAQSPPNFADPLGLQAVSDTPPTRLPGLWVVDDAPPSVAEQGLFGMWFLDFMNSLVNGYDRDGGLAGDIYRTFGGKGSFKKALKGYRAEREKQNQAALANSCVSQVAAFGAAAAYDAVFVAALSSGAGLLAEGALLFTAGRLAVAESMASRIAANGWAVMEQMQTGQSLMGLSGGIAAGGYSSFVQAGPVTVPSGLVPGASSWGAGKALLGCLTR